MDGADIARSRRGCQYLTSERNQFRAATVGAVSVNKKASDAYCRWPISVATLGVTDHPRCGRGRPKLIANPTVDGGFGLHYA